MNRWSLKSFDKLSVASRRLAAKRVAQCLVEGGQTVDGKTLAHQFQCHVAHVASLLGSSSGSRRMRQFLDEAEFIPPDLKRFICDEPLEGAEISGASVFQGRPPQLVTQQEVIEFLECSEEAWQWLRRQGIVSDPERGMGYDIDQVLRAKQTLAQQVSFTQIDSATGRTRFAISLIEWGLIQRLTISAEHAQILPEMDLIRLLDQLRLASVAGGSVSQGMHSEVSASDLSSEELGRLLASVMRKDNVRLKWSAPFRLADMVFSIGKDYVKRSF